MNIDEMKVGELKQLMQVLGGGGQSTIGKDLIGKFVIVRTYSAGVHAGTLSQHDGKECVMKDSIRIYYWDGACSLSQLAAEGTNNPDNCKFAVEIPEIYLSEAIEIIPCSASARKNIEGVKSWKK